ncbi:MAG: hypothetical protein AB7L71_16465 [Vicinamibacterales bacterium]
MRRLLVCAGLACALTVTLGREATHARQMRQAAGPIHRALDDYAAGRFDAALDAHPFDRRNIDEVIGALDAWVGLDVARGQVAARFALDVTAQRELTRYFTGVAVDDPAAAAKSGFTVPVPPVPSFDQQRFAAPIVAWARTHVPMTGPVQEWEPWWWKTSIALLQDAGEWAVLGGNPRERRNEDKGHPGWERAVFRLAREGFLADARTRLGADPRLAMAEVVTMSAALTDQAWRRTVGGGTPQQRVPARPDVLLHLQDGARQVNSGRFREVEDALEVLLDDPTLEGEAALRLAQLRLMQRDWKATTTWLDWSERTTKDGTLLAAVEYFRGWMAEQHDRHDLALANYRAAYQRYPMAPNLNTLLAAQLMRAGERTEAARVLETFMLLEFDHSRDDLWDLLVAGDARFMRVYALQMREAR